MDDMTKNPDQENVTENNEGLINDDGYIASGGKIVRDFPFSL